MIGHERPGQAVGSGGSEKFRQAGKELGLVDVVGKDVASLNTTDDHMLEESGNVYSCGSWHDGEISGIRR